MRPGQHLDAKFLWLRSSHCLIHKIEGAASRQSDRCSTEYVVLDVSVPLQPINTAVKSFSPHIAKQTSHTHIHTYLSFINAFKQTTKFVLTEFYFSCSYCFL